MALSCYLLFLHFILKNGREPKGRQILAEQLIEIEDRLTVVKNQIHTIRNLYKEY